uniref:Uncharacterized protein n=1 Tax=Anopheles minimus TaxID=112268 RepID=A0A182W4W5_9DIPT
MAESVLGFHGVSLIVGIATDGRDRGFASEQHIGVDLRTSSFSSSTEVRRARPLCRTTQQ